MTVRRGHSHSDTTGTIQPNAEPASSGNKPRTMRDRDRESTERSPLLGADSDSEYAGADASADSQAAASSFRPGHRRRASSIAQAVASLQATSTRFILLLLYLTVFLASAGGGLWVIPGTRVLQDAVCREFYEESAAAGSAGAGVDGDRDVDDLDCKADPIQARMAALYAGYMTLESIISCVAAFPWGMVADRVGRKRVFSAAILGAILDMSCVNLVCAFSRHLPLELVWVAPFMTLIGGGSGLLTAVVLGILTDILPESERARGFMLMHLISMIGNLCAPALAGALMDLIGPWPVIHIATATIASAGVLVLFIPETKPTKRADADDAVWAGAPTTDDDDEEPLPADGARSTTTGSTSSLARGLRDLRARVGESLAMLKSPSLIILLVACVSSMPALYSSMQFMAQFASKRFSVSLSQAGYLLSVSGLATLASILVVIPAASRFVRSASAPAPLRQRDDRRRDLLLARGSAVFYLLGGLAMAAAPSMPAFVGGVLVLALGAGFSSFVKSLAAVYVDAEHRTRLYSVYSIAEAAGGACASPMLAGLFTLGMRLGGVWLGLPYLGVVGCCFVGFVLLLFVRLPRDLLDVGEECPRDSWEESGEESAVDDR